MYSVALNAVAIENKNSDRLKKTLSLTLLGLSCVSIGYFVYSIHKIKNERNSEFLATIKNLYYSKALLNIVGQALANKFNAIVMASGLMKISYDFYFSINDRKKEKENEVVVYERSSFEKKLHENLDEKYLVDVSSELNKLELGFNDFQ